MTKSIFVVKKLLVLLSKITTKRVKNYYKQKHHKPNNIKAFQIFTLNFTLIYDKGRPLFSRIVSFLLVTMQGFCRGFAPAAPSREQAPCTSIRRGKPLCPSGIHPNARR